MNYKHLILFLCSIGLSANAMSLDKVDENKANISDQKMLFRKLYLAIQEDKLEEVQKLVPSQINIDGIYLDWTPLIFAVIYVRFAIIQYLIQSGADLNRRTDIGPGTIALYYLSSESVDGLLCADLIVEAMLDLTPSQKDQISFTAFCMRNATVNTALPDCALPVVERLREEYYAQNKVKTLKQLQNNYCHSVRKYLLEKYFPDQQTNEGINHDEL